MEHRQIKLLPLGLIKFYNVITIVGEDWNRFTANLPYFRTFSRERYINSRVQPDEIDNAILEKIQETYPKSYWRSELLLFENQLDDRLRIIEGFGTRLNFRIELIPNLPDPETYMKQMGEYYGYFYDFNLRVLLPKGDERMSHISPFVLCQLDREIIERHKDTIQPVV